MPRKNANKSNIHAKRLKAIRSYVNFNYDLRKPLTKYQKRKIKLYFDEIDALTARPFHVYRTKNKDHLKKAQEFAQHEKSLPGLKVAFIPTNGTDKPKIRFNKSGELVAETKHIRTLFLEFDPIKLIEDPEGHTTELIDKDHLAKSFTILAGKYEIPNSYSRSRIAAWVAKYAAKYSNAEANNYFGNWMVGLNAHHFKAQADFNEYREAKRKAKRKLQRERKNRKRRK